VENHGVQPTGVVAELVRRHREAAGLTQRQLADRAGISIGALQDLEQGRTTRPRQASLARLAAGLSLSVGQLEQPDDRRDGNGRRHRGQKEATGLRVEVLGPLAAWRDGLPLTLGPARQRAVLGLLALHADTGLRREAIVDALWGEDPPATAVAMLQAQVSRIRQLVGSVQALGGGPQLTWNGSYYRFSTDGLRLDLADFAQLAEQARREAAAGNAAAACECYERALRLWRGQPLEDIAVLNGHAAITELARRRTGLVIEYARAAASAGLPDRVVAHLEALAARELLDERVHAHLMTALAATGRQGAALRVYQDLAARLDAELGLRPGPELAAAHLRVLRQQIPPPAPPGDTAGAVAAGDPAGRMMPQQLPPAISRFVGRTAELAVLMAALEQAPGAAGTVAISAISGTAGIGKTALAVHWAHQIKGRYPDGQLYVHLRGFGPFDPVTPEEALRGFLSALHVPAEQVPSTLAGQQGLYRSLLADRRVLILLDNARHAEQVRPLLPGSPGCLVVVTSRSDLAGLVTTDCAWSLMLDVLTDAEAHELLAQRMGPARLAEEADSAAELIGLCARLPLALAIIAAQAGARPRTKLALLAAELRDAYSRLDTLATGEQATDLRAVFSWSYQSLRAPAARVFRLLGLHPGPDVTVAAAASLAALTTGQTRGLLRELTRCHLLAEPLAGRYAFHDLLRVYAAERAHGQEGEAACRAAVHRMLDHYLHTCHSAAQLMQPQRGTLTLAPAQPGVMAELLATHEDALAWCRAEHHVLLAVTQLAAGTGFNACAWQLPWSMATFLDWQGHWHDWATTQRVALAAVIRLDDKAAQATARRAFAASCSRRGDHDEACTHLTECLRIYEQLGDRAGQSRVHRDLGNLFEHQSRYAQALDHAERAVSLSRGIADQSGLAAALTNSGWYHTMLGNYQQALTYCQQALKLHRELGARYGEAHTWHSLGLIEYHLGGLAEAVVCDQHAVGLFRELGDRKYEAIALSSLGDVSHAAGDPRAARDAWRQALAILDDLHDPEAAQVRAKLINRGSPPRLVGSGGSHESAELSVSLVGRAVP
jgi:DNA-binding SARP family transcriptional activator/DNA-binding XRE family transcriptional regulator